MHLTRRRIQVGFTLLEVLVSLVLLSLIMTVSVSALFTLNQSSKRINQTSTSLDEMRLVSAFMREKLTLAQFPRGNASLFQSSLPLTGESDSLVLLSVMRAHQDQGGLHVMRFRLTQDKGLVFEWLPYVPQRVEIDWAHANALSLLPQVKRFNLLYEDADGQVSSQWHSLEKLPTFITVSIEEPERSWPAIRVRVLGAYG
ncbi:prepilin-type N-terminal cleavage/methylation domain-containing protein [Nitrincola alkalisediminis]|uniref:prepilin-type N-terminal cleavage/methylation domain-containing protein n=1 Tax=Nitrincola alkalisediminis TaxID=1366656 RepID=UPI001875E454|nr:prepilin-type N-terminal cleavage/methylation domain-containing protein [Nitrincola alkalisediminis]